MLKPILKASALLLALTAAGSISTSGQTFKAVYTYDLNGNRLTANIIYLTVSAPSAAPEVVEALEVDEPSGLTVKIYPNPTRGDLRVEIAGGPSELLEEPKSSIQVWDMQGRLIISVNPLSASNRVDLTPFCNGAYIMHLTVRGVTKSYKILKN